MEPAERIESILTTVRASGGRATSVRRAILRTLLEHHDVHPTVEHLTSTVQATLPEVAESTVYRFLDELERLGIVQHVRLGAGPSVYHFTEDTSHHHLLCTECGQVTEIPDDLLDALRTRVRRDFAFQLEPQHLSLGGRCVRCPTASTMASSADDAAGSHEMHHVHGRPHTHD